MKSLFRVLVVSGVFAGVVHAAPREITLGFDGLESIVKRWGEIQPALVHAPRIPVVEGRGKHVWCTPEVSPEALIGTDDGQGYFLPLVVTPPEGKRLAMAVFVTADRECMPAGIISPEGVEIKTSQRFAYRPAWCQDRRWMPGGRAGGFWLPARDLSPGRDHFILFSCRKGASAGISICVTFLPTEPEFFSGIPSQIDSYLGLKPMSSREMADVCGWSSVRIIREFPEVKMQNPKSSALAELVAPEAMRQFIEEPGQTWMECRMVSVRSTERRAQRVEALEFSSDAKACPLREDVVKVGGEPVVSVPLEELLRFRKDTIKQAEPAPRFLSDVVPGKHKGIRVEYYDVMATLVNDEQPPRVVGTWLVGGFMGDGKLKGKQTFQLPRTRVRAFLSDGKCVGLVGGFGEEESERLMDADPPAGTYIERTSMGDTYASFETDGKSNWKVSAVYPGDKPRFSYSIEGGGVAENLELWRFSGEKLEKVDSQKDQGDEGK